MKSIEGHEETIAKAIKVSRTDLVNMIAAEALEEVAEDVRQAELGLADIAKRFRNEAIDTAKTQLAGELVAVRRITCKELYGFCDYELPSRIERGPEPIKKTVEIVFRDKGEEWDATVRLPIVLEMEEGDTLMQIVAEWDAAHDALQLARARDSRMSAVKNDVRKAVIAAALDGTEEGRALLAQCKALAKALKLRLADGGAE